MISNITGSSITINGGQVGEIGGLIAWNSGRAEFTDVTITGLNINSRNDAGGVLLYAENSVSFTRVHAAGSITATAGAGGITYYVEQSAGGVGLEMDESSFTGTLTGDSGGLAYYIYLGTSTISKSFFKGTQTGITDTAGGLIALQESNMTISDSYAISNLTDSGASDGVAGLVGYDMKNLIINRSYFSGSVTAVSSRACIADISATFSFTANNVYYNSTFCTANASSTGALAGVTAVTTAGLQVSSPFAGWSSSVWTFSAGQNPKLAWEP